ncbi:MAG TPA: hypothetical protein PLI68_01530 [Bacteroidia bacterium]|nr:hypothetical protein [Bacteroidia bacterium]HRH09051.1 hypothetical protein [Bacteroidia bacterium]HRH61985.1 hypothetical protein [Bacteroidia bacterium]
MNTLKKPILIALVFTVLGFFANWAQNDYGMKLIGFCMLIISACIWLICYLQLQLKQSIKITFLLTYAGLLFLSLFNNANFPEELLVACVLFSIFAPTILIPVLILISERKSPIKTNYQLYFTNVFLAFFCIGNYFKLNHLFGAGPVLTFSAFLFIPFFYFAFLKIKSSIILKNSGDLLIGIMHVFIAFNIVAFVFKTQHWPGGNALAYSTVAIFVLLILIILFFTLKKQPFVPSFSALPWIKKTAFFCFALTCLFYVLRLNGLAPSFYSSEYPIALQELINNSNGITEVGLKNTKKAHVYLENYENFLDHRDKK